jgi:sarcosine oxidase subunit alpha
MRNRLTNLATAGSAPGELDSASGTGCVSFERRLVPFAKGDTVATALFRAGVRVVSRSFKYHRPRGLYCLTGDCPNCLVTVDGEPGVRSCVTTAVDGQRIARGRGWPSTDRDIFSVLWRFRRLLPVGFYYKSLGRPAWLWPRVEPLIRALTGLGPVETGLDSKEREVIHLHPDLLVIGGGVAGLSAASTASSRGQSVLLVEEGRIADKIASADARAAARRLHAELLEHSDVTVVEDAAAIGVYDGPQVPVDARDRLHIVWPRRIIVATGAVERHPVFPNNDLPGIWLSRGAARLAVVHGLKCGKRAVVAGDAGDTEELIQALTNVGVDVVALVTRSAGVRDTAAQAVVEGRIARAVGGKRLRAVIVAVSGGALRRIRCDALVLAEGLEPRDSLLRQVDTDDVTGAGDVVAPGCSVQEAIESGRRAATGEAQLEAQSKGSDDAVENGFVCLCEDVAARDLVDAWDEGFNSTELLKRYTTACMGPCRGALCHAHLRAFVVGRAPGQASLAAATTARPPARPIRLEDAAAGTRYTLEQRTALHDRHVALGATMERIGAWVRPESYGDLENEYAAVRERVSVMDVGTLGKFLLAGQDVVEFLELLYPCRVRDLEAGRIRYALLLNEAGHVTDDGMICALGDGRYYLTFTSGGAEEAEVWIRYWIDKLGLEVYVINETSSRGAINLAGPRARDVLARLGTIGVDPESFPYMRVREIVVAEVPCIAVRLGFVGELSFELHHPSSRSAELWDALLAAGAADGIAPHGLEALRLLRLEKGHIIIGQDTDFDSGPRNLGLDFAVKLDKPTFVGKNGVLRNLQTPLRQRLALIRFDGAAPPEGSALSHNELPVGHLTSARTSPVLGYGVGLGWLRAADGLFPGVVRCSDGEVGHVVTEAFYDPDGLRLRA